MGTNKFSKDKFPWHVGEFNNVRIDTSDDTITLKSGETVGDYITIVYQDVGDKVQISWQADETYGEVNEIPGASPKVIAIRTSDTRPIDSSVSIGISGLVPIYTKGMVNTGDTWVAVPTATYATDTLKSMGSGLYLNIGYPFQVGPEDNTYLHLYSQVIIEKGVFVFDDSADDTLKAIGSGLYATKGTAYNPLVTYGQSEQTYLHLYSTLVITKS